MECSKSSSKKEACSNTILPHETRKTLNRHLKQLEKEQKTSKISRRQEIIKIRAEINEKEMEETILKIIKLKVGSLRR